jgi:hypothetical protein
MPGHDGRVAPTNASVTGFPSEVMNRAAAGSASIAVFGSMSASRHRRNIRRSVSITGPFVWARMTPGLTGAIIGFPSSKTSGNIQGAYRRRGEERKR